MVILTADGEKGLCTGRAYPQGGASSTEPEVLDRPSGAQREPEVRVAQVDTCSTHKRPLLLQVQEAAAAGRRVWSQMSKPLSWEWNHHTAGRTHAQGRSQTAVTHRGRRRPNHFQ